VLTIVFSFPSEAQEKGRIGINVKAHVLVHTKMEFSTFPFKDSFFLSSIA